MQVRELLRVTVPPEAAGLRLDDFLRRRYGFSRTLIRRLKVREGLWVNGAPAPANRRLAAGDEVAVFVAEAPSAGLRPEPLPLMVVYEDSDLLVVNKPPGLVAHPARGHKGGTLANAVAAHLAAAGLEVPVRPIQRLDRDTTGLVAFAKNPWIHAALAGRLHRVYLAVAAGQVAGDEGEVDAPIRPAPDSTIAYQVHPEGRPARTRWRVLRRWPGATLLEVTPVTGRTHQIRVHLAHLGHPLLGDTLYGAPDPRIPRQALHAAQLTFTHPRTGAVVRLEAPLPEDMAGLIRCLEGEAAGG